MANENLTQVETAGDAVKTAAVDALERTGASDEILATLTEALNDLNNLGASSEEHGTSRDGDD